ncbi:Uncharacterised protein, partial [Mycoplasmopsis edwardii]
MKINELLLKIDSKYKVSKDLSQKIFEFEYSNKTYEVQFW